MIILARGDKEKYREKLCPIVDQFKKPDAEQVKKKSELSLKKNNLLGHEITENGITTNNEKIKAVLQIKSLTCSIKLKLFLGTIQYITKLQLKPSEKADRMRQLLRKKSEWNWTERKEKDFNEIKKMITEIPCLAKFASDRDTVVTTDASQAGL